MNEPRRQARASALEEPLLVANPANVRYLCRARQRSNAALVVEPERRSPLHGLPLRARRPARSKASSSWTQNATSSRRCRSSCRSAVGFEATWLSFERYSRLHAGGIEPVPRYGLVEELRAVKDDGRARRDPTGGRDRATRAFERFADEGNIVGRTERELAWRFEQLLHEANAEGVSFPVTMASGPNSAQAAHGAQRPRHRAR